MNFSVCHLVVEEFKPTRLQLLQLTEVWRHLFTHGSLKFEHSTWNRLKSGLWWLGHCNTLILFFFFCCTFAQFSQTLAVWRCPHIWHRDSLVYRGLSDSLVPKSPTLLFILFFIAKHGAIHYNQGFPLLSCLSKGHRFVQVLWFIQIKAWFQFILCKPTPYCHVPFRKEVIWRTSQRCFACLFQILLS